MFQQLQQPSKSASKKPDQATKPAKAVSLNVIQSAKSVEPVEIDLPVEKPLPAKPLAKDAVSTRRLGKRSDPDYIPVNLLIKQGTYNKCRIKLLQADSRNSSQIRDISDLVEMLLADYLSRE